MTAAHEVVEDGVRTRAASKSYVKVERSMTIRRPVGLMLAVEEI